MQSFIAIIKQSIIHTTLFQIISFIVRICVRMYYIINNPNIQNNYNDLNSIHLLLLHTARVKKMNKNLAVKISYAGANLYHYAI